MKELTNEQIINHLFSSPENAMTNEKSATIEGFRFAERLYRDEIGKTIIEAETNRRDNIATQAMVGYMSMYSDPNIVCPNPERIAEQSYVLADALIAEGKKPK